MAYRLYPDGRRELVRGVDIVGTPLTALGSIIAASREVESFNGICGAESGWVPVSLRRRACSSPRSRSSAASPTSIVRRCCRRPACAVPRQNTHRLFLPRTEVLNESRDESRAVCRVRAARHGPCRRAGPCRGRGPCQGRARRTVARVTSDIIDAVAEEIERAMAGMQIPGEPKPYFVGHKLTEVEVNDVVASLGAITWKQQRHFVTIEARVHVGDYQLDSSNFVIANAEETDGVATFQLPMEATPRIARRAAWLVTDAATRRRWSCSGPSSTPVAPTATASPTIVRATPRRRRWCARSQCSCPPWSRPTISRSGPRRSRRCSRATPHVRDSRIAFTSFSSGAGTSTARARASTTPGA